MLQRNFRVWSGAAAIALAAVACTDSTTPHGTPARPSFWGGGGTPACFRVTGGGRIDKPEPSTPYPQSKNKDHDFATFGFQARPTACNSTDGAGEIEWVDHSPSAPGHGFTLHGTVSSFSAVVDHYYPDRQCGSFSGTGHAKAHDHSFNQDVSFTVDHACDEGEPGKGRDHIRMIIASLSYDRAGILTGGNIHQHSLKGQPPPPPSTGNLTGSNTTTGSSAPASYTVTVDAGTASARTGTMAPGGSVTFTDLPAGSHSVMLTVASNCTVTSTNPQTVTVTAGSTASASFTVNCPTPPTTGDLMVSNTTTGSSAPASYTVTVDAGAASARTGTMAPGGSVTFTDLPAGSHSVTLTVASNCTLATTDPSRGAEFDVIARRNNGPGGSPGSLIHIHVVACDNGPAGSGLDFFGLRVQENGFTKSGFLTSGDVVKSSF